MWSGESERVLEQDKGSKSPALQRLVPVGHIVVLPRAVVTYFSGPARTPRRTRLGRAGALGLTTGRGLIVGLVTAVDLHRNFPRRLPRGVGLVVAALLTPETLVATSASLSPGRGWPSPAPHARTP